jgi:non-specific serine/threonine protein kinase
MPEFMQLRCSISPEGQLKVRESSESGESVDGALGARIVEAFTRSQADGLFHLACIELEVHLPAVLSHWQGLSRHFMASVCGLADLEETRSCESLPAPENWLQDFYEQAPPQIGLDFLSLEVLQGLWRDMKELFDERLQQWEGPIQELLSSLNPSWNLVGRVYFHLAENKRDNDRPFAFMASYTTRLDQHARPQHLPLARAIQEFSEKEQRQGLINLLKPIHRASLQLVWLKEMSDNASIFHPQKWTSQEAHRFLTSIPTLEAAGLMIRVPNWWNPSAPPQARMTINLGGRKPSGLGVDALLDFSIQLSLGDEPIEVEDLRQLLQYAEGLVLFRGKWIEVDHEKLQTLLDQWHGLRKKVESDGISFMDGLRMLAGVDDLASESRIPESIRDSTRVLAGPWLSQILESIRNPSNQALVRPGPGLKAKLRVYQEKGVHWLWMMNQLRLGACLADDMGLGKTIQVLSLLLIKKREKPGHRSLLIVPTSLLNNWQNEAQRFAPGLSLKILHASAKGGEDNKVLFEEQHDLYLTSYGMGYRLEGLQEMNWDLLILDEAQAIKNPAARTTQSIKSLRAEHRLALTGTPVENGIGDLWSIMDFIAPGLLSGPAAFRKYLEKATSHGRSPYGGIRKLVQPYILRRLKTDRSIIADLPEKTEIKSYCYLAKMQAALYEDAVRQMEKQLVEVEGIQRRGIVLSYLLRLKQICNHPSQWTQDGLFRYEDSGKLKRLKELCEDIAAKQEKVLVFTQFREITDVLSRFLAGIFGEPGFVLHGGTPVKQRKSMVESFQDDNGPPFFVLSLKAGGTGLNLTKASHVIHFDRWWNPAVENQATDRAFRIGQKKNVLVHKFVCKGTLEERIDKLLFDKLAISEEILKDGESSFLTEMSNAELMDLVRLDLESISELD